MGAMKRFAEEVSVSMGFGGELNDEVLTEAQKRMARKEVDKAFLDYEDVKYHNGAGSIKGHEAYTIWSDALDRYNNLSTS